jgi:hypothetical protein
LWVRRITDLTVPCMAVLGAQSSNALSLPKTLTAARRSRFRPSTWHRLVRHRLVRHRLVRHRLVRHHLVRHLLLGRLASCKIQVLQHGINSANLVHNLVRNAQTLNVAHPLLHQCRSAAWQAAVRESRESKIDLRLHRSCILYISVLSRAPFHYVYGSRTVCPAHMQ